VIRGGRIAAVPRLVSAPGERQTSCVPRACPHPDATFDAVQPTIPWGHYFSRPKEKGSILVSLGETAGVGGRGRFAPRVRKRSRQRGIRIGSPGPQRATRCRPELEARKVDRGARRSAAAS